MKSMFVKALAGVCVLALMASLAAALQEGAKDAAKNEAAKGDAAKKNAELKKKGSYAIGVNIGRSIKGQGLDVDPAELAKGIADILGGKKPALADEELQQAIRALAQLAKEMKLSRGLAFLEKNKKAKGVKVTASGLQYLVLKAGTGALPKKTDTVRVHYKGTLIDGTVFDSSYKRGKPAEFPVTGVIKGWVEACQLMKVGSKWKIVVPSALGYGRRGAGELIGPDEVLVFEIEMLGIVN